MGSTYIFFCRFTIGGSLRKGLIMKDLGPVAGLLSIVLIVGSFFLGNKEDPIRKKTLYWGIGLFVFGVLAGNGLLNFVTEGL